MFALVDEIELYPDFLPWCEKTQVTRNDDEVRATVFINYHGLRTSFSTKNRHQPPDKIDMALTKGPLSSLSGGWRFIDLGDGRSRVEFDLTYRFANRLFAKTFEKLFEKFFGHFVDTFIVRARGKIWSRRTRENSRASGGRRIRYPMAMRYRFTEWRDFGRCARRLRAGKRRLCRRLGKTERA